jgi:hypothetical protein
MGCASEIVFGVIPAPSGHENTKKNLVATLLP